MQDSANPVAPIFRNPLRWVREASPKALFLGGAHLYFGLWILYLGLSKLFGGPAGTVEWMQSQFAETWVPAALVAVLAWAIIALENIVGIWLITGIRARWAWIFAADLLFLLAMGKTVLGDFATVADNWFYLALALVAASLSGSGSAGASRTDAT